MLKNKIKRFIHSTISHIIALNNDYNNKYNNLLNIFDRYVNYGNIHANNFNFENYANNVIAFVESMKTTNSYEYRYASSVAKPTIYGSVYACLLYFLLNKDATLSDEVKKGWVEYFDSFQSTEGLFIDPNLESENYYNVEWWGANHLSAHLIICYTYLNAKPKYEFNYIKKYYEKQNLIEYLNSLDFDNVISTDSDNAIMNLGVLLQYQRDFFNDTQAQKTLDILFTELEKRINPKWGSWGYGSYQDIQYLSRTQQFAYHLYPLWIYDARPIQNSNKLIDVSLKTQTQLGGFGPQLNSSACEDIDCIDLLIKLSKISSYKETEIKKALQKALPWVLTNQNDDGGFVFRRNESFAYGHPLTTSGKNESNLFATWFRTLSLAYLCNYLQIPSHFNIGRVPGMQFIEGK